MTDHREDVLESDTLPDYQYQYEGELDDTETLLDLLDSDEDTETDEDDFLRDLDAVITDSLKKQNALKQAKRRPTDPYAPVIPPVRVWKPVAIVAQFTDLVCSCDDGSAPYMLDIRFDGYFLKSLSGAAISYTKIDKRLIETYDLPKFRRRLVEHQEGCARCVPNWDWERA